ncbi:MAG: substrate-binding domain-containing protein [Desulfomonilaceae bacterium]
MIQPWIADFERDYPGKRVVLSASTHSRGFDSFLDGDTDIWMTGRALNADERDRAAKKKIGFSEVTLLMDGVAIIVNESNPVKALSLDQLANVFSGGITNWNQIGGSDAPIKLINVTPTSGLPDFLSQEVFKKPIDSKAKEIDPPKNVPMYVRSDPHSIGFCRSGLALFGMEKVKVIAISRTNDSSPTQLTKASMLDGSYPITRPLGLCYNQSNSKAG